MIIEFHMFSSAPIFNISFEVDYNKYEKKIGCLGKILAHNTTIHVNYLWLVLGNKGEIRTYERITSTCTVNCHNRFSSDKKTSCSTC